MGAIILSLILGSLGWLVWGRRSAIVLALVSFSHWLLDLIVHRADLPILPGNAGNLPRLGFGLWAEPGMAAALELLLVVGGAALYWQAAYEVSRDAGRRRILAHVSGALVLVLACLCCGWMSPPGPAAREVKRIFWDGSPRPVWKPTDAMRAVKQ
ncbi:MAG: hypothetical protein WDN06_00415 [Asticcacaulis sp.]